jgi:putative intracellular protease/amidase
MAPKVLVVLTSADTNTFNDAKTGWYLPELAHPYHILHSKDVEITVASPKGGVAPLDPSSVEMFKEDKVSTDFLNNNKAVWEQTAPLKQFLGRSGEFDALIYPGGHGPLFDLATDEESIALISEFWQAGKIVSAICHGPAVFKNVKINDQPFVKGRALTGFTDTEEELVGLTKAVPFLLESVFKEQGASFDKAPEPWGSKVVVDGKLITGQNPASGSEFGEALAKALNV